MFSFEKINLCDALVIVALSTALIMAVTKNMNELSMSIGSGLLGYIGGSVKGTHGKADELKQ